MTIENEKAPGPEAQAQAPSGPDGPLAGPTPTGPRRTEPQASGPTGPRPDGQAPTGPPIIDPTGPARPHLPTPGPAGPGPTGPRLNLQERAQAQASAPGPAQARTVPGPGPMIQAPPRAQARPSDPGPDGPEAQARTSGPRSGLTGRAQAFTERAQAPAKGSRARTLADGTVVPPDPAWLTWSIILALTLLTIAGLVLAAASQIMAAQGSGVHDGRQFLAPFVLELISLLWILMGYKRGRSGSSPWGYWTLAAAFSAFSVLLVTQHAPSFGAMLLFAGSSVSATILTFAKFYEDLRVYRRDVLKQTSPELARYGKLWKINRTLARRARHIDIEHGIGERERTIQLAQLWLVVYDSVLDFKLDQLTWKQPFKRARARKLAVRMAGRAVAKEVGAPVANLPKELELIFIQVQDRAPIEAPPAPPIQARPEAPAIEAGPSPVPAPPKAPTFEARHPGLGPDPQAQAREAQAPGPRPQARRGPLPTAPVSPAPAGPNPGPGPQAQASGPGPAGPSIDELLELIRDQFQNDEKIHSIDFYKADLEKLTTVTDGTWLTQAAHPKKEEIIDLCNRGSGHAGNIRRIVQKIRETYTPTTS